MFRSIGLALTAVALIATPAASAKTKTYKLHGNGIAGVAGAKDGNLIVAGPVYDAVVGDGAMLFLDATTGKSVVSPFTAYFAKGSFSGLAKLDAIVQEDGSIVYENGRLEIKRGTGAYKGAKGAGTFGGGKTKDNMFTIDYKLSFRVS